jgi:hypothetical protein
MAADFASNCLFSLFHDIKIKTRTGGKWNVMVGLGMANFKEIRVLSYRTATFVRVNLNQI